MPPPGATAAGRRALDPADDRGTVLWDFLSTLIASRRVFLSIQRHYDQRVLVHARERAVDRMQLKLPPRELFKLFHLGRLECLRDDRLEALKTLAPRIFGDEGDVGLMDAYCGHIFHEVSILSREHRSVGRFVRRHDPRRYQQLFEEVSGYYPERLKRVKRFFGLAMRRLDELLPRWSEDRVIVRSIYLFGDRLARQAWGHGKEEFYKRMYPQGGVIRGYAEAARSFHESGFDTYAREAAQEALGVSAGYRARRTLMADERRALADAQAVREALGSPTG